MKIAKTIVFYYLFFSISSFAEQPTPRNLRIYEVEFEGKPYWAVVIRPIGQDNTAFYGLNKRISTKILTEGSELRSFGKRLTRTEEKPNVIIDDLGTSYQLAENILKRAEVWLMNLYEERGLFKKDTHGEMRATFLESENLLKGDSSFVLMTEKGHLSKILAMSRIAKIKSQKELVPMEARVKGTPAEGVVPRIEPTSEPQEKTEYIWDGQDAEVSYSGGKTLPANPKHALYKVLEEVLPVHFSKLKTKWFYYDTAEFKNLARVRNISLIAPMMTIAAAHGLAFEGGQMIPEHLVGPQTLTVLSPSGLRFWAGPAGHQVAHLGQIVGECDGEELRDFYLSKGFEIIRSFENPQMKGSTTYWLKITPENFVKNFIQSYTGELENSTPLSLQLLAGNSPNGHNSCYYFLGKLGVTVIQ